MPEKHCNLHILLLPQKGVCPPSVSAMIMSRDCDWLPHGLTMQKDSDIAKKTIIIYNSIRGNNDERTGQHME